MINVLMVVYEFPPLNSGGSHRPYKFAKNLYKFGIHPIIVTPNIGVHTGKNIDDNLFEESEEMTVIRTPVDAPKVYDKLLESYYLNIVGIEGARWRKHCLAAVDAIMKKNSISALFITVPPFSIVGLAREIGKKYNLPILLDMRDAWSQWVITPYASYLHYQLTLRKECSALNAASAIVVTSEQTMQDLQALHPNVDSYKFSVVTNAYDESLPILKDTLALSPTVIDKPFAIGYLGSFYYAPYQRDLIFKRWWEKKPYQYFQYAPRREDWLYRSPYFFFASLAKLREQLPELPNLLTVKFVGSIANWLPKMIEDFQLSDIVKLEGRVSHKEALEFQRNVDALLITSSKVLNGLDYSIAGKTFEYAVMNKPIIAFVSEGAQKKLLEKIGLSICCPPDNVDASAKMLSDLLNGRIMLRPNKTEIEQLSIQYTTKQLACIIKRISNVKF
jgi:hypothetical protein